MRIAIAANGNTVSGHFGHCEGFKVYEVEAGNLKGEEFLECPEHKPGLLPRYLKENNIDVIIAGGMGGRAQDLFAENNIGVIVGVEGEVNQAINSYINNELVSSNSVCNNHEHAGDCGNH